MAELKEAVSAYLMQHEGITSYVYLDHYGNLTYGVGHNVGSITKDETLKKMKAMALYKDGTKSTDSVALTDLEVERSYNDLKNFFEKNKKFNENSKKDELNYKHSYYQNTYKIKVSEDLVKKEFERNVDTAISDAKRNFKNFDQLPLDARIALTDISFALGASKLKGYPKLKQYVESNDLKNAANEVTIRGWNGSRTQEVKALLGNTLAAPLPPSTPTPTTAPKPTPTPAPKQKKLPGLDNFFTNKLKR